MQGTITNTKNIFLKKWFARSGLLLLVSGLAGCIVIHSSSAPEEKSASEQKSPREKTSLSLQVKEDWICDETAETEVIELHKFFEGWYSGEIPRTDENFTRLTDVIAEDFQLITATGVTVNKALLTTLMKSSHGTKQNLNKRIENIRLRAQDNNLCLLTYEEYGNTEGGEKKVLTSAVLRRAPEKRNRLEWLHVHEVNVPVREQQNDQDESTGDEQQNKPDIKFVP